MFPADRPATRLATRLLFFVAGFGYSCWAPLVPFVKIRLGIGDDILGMLLLCIGAGSIVAMAVTGALAARFGGKTIIIGSGFGFALALALVAVSNTTFTLGLALAAFGATLGALDVTMNLHGAEVERAAGTPMMSGFHAHFSIGGFAGSAFMTFLLSKHLGIVPGGFIASAVMIAAMAVITPRLLDGRASKEGPLFALPRGTVLVIAFLAAITFLVEGALLDWGALLITENALVPVDRGGMGYMVFSIAMTVCRLAGDAVSARYGDRNTLVWGGVIALAGFVTLLFAPAAGFALVGFALVGVGCSNIVPVFFRRASAQASMPPGLAIAAVSTTAYAGILAGPAAIGFVAKAAGLHTAFWMLAGLLALVPVCARLVTSNRH